jgi:hypothetical protein
VSLVPQALAVLVGDAEMTPAELTALLDQVRYHRPGSRDDVEEVAAALREAWAENERLKRTLDYLVTGAALMAPEIERAKEMLRG